MKEIVLARIDDRLIHGQVMTSWLNYTSANKIIVVDDLVVQDAFMTTIMKTCLPANIAFEIFGVEDGSEKLKNGLTDKDRVILLVKYPKTILEMMEKGVQFEKLNIGGMGAGGARKKFYKNISASDEEKEILKSIIGKGCKVEIQIIAEDKAIDVAKLV